MPVTELSRLVIKEGLNEGQITTVLQLLSRAKELMEDFTGYDFSILREVENPNHVYITGQWASVEDHMKSWIPSEANQGLLKDLASLVEVDYLFHIDVAFGAFPPNKTSPMFSIGRHVMASAKRSGFAETFDKRRNGLEAHAPGPLGGGWRVDNESDREEFVLFVPWKSVDQHMAFAKTPEFQEYSEIRHHLLVDATEIRHASLMNLGVPAGKNDAA